MPSPPSLRPFGSAKHAGVVESWSDEKESAQFHAAIAEDAERGLQHAQ